MSLYTVVFTQKDIYFWRWNPSTNCLNLQSGLGSIDSSELTDCDTCCVIQKLSKVYLETHRTIYTILRPCERSLSLVTECHDVENHEFYTIDVQRYVEYELFVYLERAQQRLDRCFDFMQRSIFWFLDIWSSISLWKELPPGKYLC